VKPFFLSLKRFRFIKGLLFHSFPVDQHRFELWRQTVFNHCSQTLSINKHSKICYRHFHPDDYIANHTGLTRYLKATAIPLIFTKTNLSPSITLNNHLLTSSIDTNTNRNVFSETASSHLLLPLKSSSSVVAVPTSTNTKAKRLLNTIDKLHQIQNANKVVMTQKQTPEIEPVKQDEDDNNKIISDNNLSLDNSLQKSQESDTFCCTDNLMVSLPKTHLEDALFKFLEQANLLQYYSAFIEQGLTLEKPNLTISYL